MRSVVRADDAVIHVVEGHEQAPPLYLTNCPLLVGVLEEQTEQHHGLGSLDLFRISLINRFTVSGRALKKHGGFSCSRATMRPTVTPYVSGSRAIPIMIGPSNLV